MSFSPSFDWLPSVNWQSKFAFLPARMQPQGWGAWWAPWSLLVVPALTLLWAWAMELRGEHILVTVLFLVFAWAGPRWRQLSAVLAPFVLIGITYETQRYLLPFRGTIHIEDLYRWEQALFTLPGASDSISNWIAAHTHPFLDFITGVAYILYLAQTVGVALWLFYRRDDLRALRLAFGFAWINLVGWATWILWPAAPPWYVDLYGLGPAVLDAPASTAGTARFDELIGIPIFAQFYAKSENVFGAMPSLHTGYAVLTAWICWEKRGVLRWFTVLFALVIAFGAVYLRHHYILDVLGGVIFALLTDLCVQAGMRWQQRRKAARSPSLQEGAVLFPASRATAPLTERVQDAEEMISQPVPLPSEK